LPLTKAHNKHNSHHYDFRPESSEPESAKQANNKPKWLPTLAPLRAGANLFTVQKTLSKVELAPILQRSFPLEWRRTRG